MVGTVEELSNFLLEIITLVSSANKMGSDKVFIVGGRSFIYIMKCKDPKIDHWGTPCFTVPQFEENFSNDFISVFWSLCVRILISQLLFFACHNNITSLAKFHDLHSEKILLNHTKNAINVTLFNSFVLKRIRKFFDESKVKLFLCFFF
jgi:hypothetical protein